MNSTDPISDMFSRIRNAIRVNKRQISLPHSKVKEDIAKLLADAGFLNNISSEEENNRKTLQIEIADVGQPFVITEINRLSRPGKKLYVRTKEIPNVKRGRGIVIISTSQGIMTGSEAAAKKLGGELIGEVY